MAQGGFEQSELFHMDPAPRPGRPAADGPKWGGRAVMKLRAALGATLPAACWRGCGRIVQPGDKWHVGHIIDRAAGGERDPKRITLDQVAVECEHCNLSAGGKLGAAITNGPKRPIETFREKGIKWY